MKLPSRRNMLLGFLAMTVLAAVIAFAIGRLTRPGGGGFAQFHILRGTASGARIIDLHGNYKPVVARKFEGNEVVGGDMIVAIVSASPRPLHSNLSRAVAISSRQLLWPGGIVPYKVDDSIPDSDPRRAEIAQGMKDWGAPNTPIHFVSPPPPNAKAYVVFVGDPTPDSCESWVGMRGDGSSDPSQKLIIGTLCGQPQVDHEIGHLLGLDHEQNRHDRDTYLTVYMANIEDGAQDYFNVADSSVGYTFDIGNFDFGSLMEYDEYAFSKAIGQLPTITVNASIPDHDDLTKSIGFAQRPSSSDLAAVTELYTGPSH
jgi:Astacin (Peptidase family M12A)